MRWQLFGKWMYTIIWAFMPDRQRKARYRIFSIWKKNVSVNVDCWWSECSTFAFCFHLCQNTTKIDYFRSLIKHKFIYTNDVIDVKVKEFIWAVTVHSMLRNWIFSFDVAMFRYRDLPLPLQPPLVARVNFRVSPLNYFRVL